MKRHVASIMMIALLGLGAAPACVTRVVTRQPAPPPRHYPPGASATVELFYNDLAPYGNWIRVDGPGWVWSPAGTPAGWRPYALGRWAYTDYGWTWVSDEQWGWAVYHYGRWHHAPGHGWVWVPGSEWGPAWVTWHSGGGWTGWAPLPWQVAWHAGVGLEWGDIDVRVAIQPAWWCFMPTRHMADPNPSRHYVPSTRNVTLIRTTTHVTNYTIVDNRVFNQGVQVNVVSKAAGRPVPKLKVRESDSPRTTPGEAMQGDELLVFRHGRDDGRGRDTVQDRVNRPEPVRAGKPDTRTSQATPPPAPKTTPHSTPVGRTAKPAPTPANDDQPAVNRESPKTRSHKPAQTRTSDDQTTRPSPDGDSAPATAPDDDPGKPRPATATGKQTPTGPQATRPQPAAAKGKSSKPAARKTGKAVDPKSEKEDGAAKDDSEQDAPAPEESKE